jgi:hypothetical protein
VRLARKYGDVILIFESKSPEGLHFVIPALPIAKMGSECKVW